MIKFSKIQKVDLKAYKNQSNVRRSKVPVGGFEKIVYATDQDWPERVIRYIDLDGFHIRGLLSGFIKRYLPEFEDRIGMLQTPIVAFRKNGKVQRWSYDIKDTNPQKGEVADYKKGLGSWDVADLKMIIQKDGLDKMIEMVDFNSDDSDLAIEDWLGNDSEPRKKHIQNTDFSIANI